MVSQRKEMREHMKQMRQTWAAGHKKANKGKGGSEESGGAKGQGM
jgi:hypothetical protein